MVENESQQNQTDEIDQPELDDQYIDDEQMTLPGDEERDQQSPNFKPKKTKKFPKKALFMLGIGLLILAIGVGLWKLIPSKDDSSSQSQPPVQTNTEQDNSSQQSGLGVEALDKEYTSDFLRISLKYPSSWTVNEVDDAITVKSPNFKHRQNNGMEKDGFFKIYIRKGATDSDGKYLGKGYAVANSEKIKYSDPATGQRPETFLTDFGLETPDNFAYFIVQGNFDLEKGETLGPNYAKEIDAYLITGGFSSSDLTDNMATNLLALSEYKSNNAYLTAVEIIKSLKIK